MRAELCVCGRRSRTEVDVAITMLLSARERVEGAHVHNALSGR